MRFDAGPGVYRTLVQGETGTTVAPGTVRPARSRGFALGRKIPDDPNYQRHVPLEYRLDAKAIVGEVAQDIGTRGHRAHFWVEVGHMALVAAKIAFEASTLVAGLAIGAPLLAAVGNFMALGAGYVEAAQKIAARWAATGYSRGVVMGANRRPASLLKDYFGNDHFPPNPAFPRGRDVAIANYRMGLLVGYVHGRALTNNQHVIFWRDLGRRMGDQSHRGPQNKWGRREWIDWYVELAAVFRRDHLT